MSCRVRQLDGLLRQRAGGRHIPDRPLGRSVLDRRDGALGKARLDQGVELDRLDHPAEEQRSTSLPDRRGVCPRRSFATTGAIARARGPSDLVGAQVEDQLTGVARPPQCGIDARVARARPGGPARGAADGIRRHEAPATEQRRPARRPRVPRRRRPPGPPRGPTASPVATSASTPRSSLRRRSMRQLPAALDPARPRASRPAGRRRPRAQGSRLVEAVARPSCSRRPSDPWRQLDRGSPSSIIRPWRSAYGLL